MTPYSRRSFLDDPNYFAAVSDAISGCKWPALSPCEGSTFKTQKRHLARWILLLGASPSLGEDEQLQAALTLKVSMLILREGAAKIREGPTYKDRAQIVLGILNQIDEEFSLAAILQRGSTAEVWGRPMVDERDRVPLLNFTMRGIR